MSTLEYQQVHEAATIRARSHTTRPSPQDVEDIAQETVARYAKQEPGSIENPAAWANTVAGNLCVNLARSQRGERPEMDDNDGPEALERFLVYGTRSSRAGIAIMQTGILLAMLTPRERQRKLAYLPTGSGTPASTDALMPRWGRLTTVDPGVRGGHG
ncbi:MAG: hypothetical protein HQ453_11600 [Actinobacteria bacterium]|nr:hypothetical protein [Actinomycetota bacterium]